MANIWLIRHGESQANAGIRTSDPARIEITAQGLKQANDVALSFKEKPDLIITSPYIRTKQTAQPTLDRFPDVPAIEWDEVKEFTYLSPLACQNTTILDRQGMVNSYWDGCDPEYIHGEGAESFSRLVSRTEIVRRKLKALPDHFIVVFSHMQFIAIFTWLMDRRITSISVDQMREFKQYLDQNKLKNGEKVEIENKDEGIF